MPGLGDRLKKLPDPFSESGNLSNELLSNQLCLAPPVMSVDPDLMVMMPTPMSWNPAPVSSPGPVTVPVNVIWTIAYIDADTNCVRGAHESAHAKQSSKK
jgi:hypothetical protein